ncbi:hypothetical protein KCU65_g8828, partial [Aureobasidium melanogenum]
MAISFHDLNSKKVYRFLFYAGQKNIALRLPFTGPDVKEIDPYYMLLELNNEAVRTLRVYLKDQGADHFGIRVGAVRRDDGTLDTFGPAGLVELQHEDSISFFYNSGKVCRSRNDCKHGRKCFPDFERRIILAWNTTFKITLERNLPRQKTDQAILNSNLPSDDFTNVVSYEQPCGRAGSRAAGSDQGQSGSTVSLSDHDDDDDNDDGNTDGLADQAAIP